MDRWRRFYRHRFQSLRFHLSTSETDRFQNNAFSKRSSFKTMFQSYRFSWLLLVFFELFSLHDRRKRIKNYVLSNENPLVLSGHQLHQEECNKRPAKKLSLFFSVFRFKVNQTESFYLSFSGSKQPITDINLYTGKIRTGKENPASSLKLETDKLSDENFNVSFLFYFIYFFFSLFILIYSYRSH